MTPEQVAARGVETCCDISGMAASDLTVALVEEMAAARDKALATATELQTEFDAAADTFAAAVGFYDCPCGSEFEFFEDNGLEEYGALNRWLGEHVGKCSIGCQVPPSTAERDNAIRERDDALAKLDNMVDLTIEVGRLGNYLKHAIAEKDDYRERLDEMRDKYQAAQCRMDEMAAELAEARS